jgi:GNAT superfamily N-acetyltransferase
MIMIDDARLTAALARLLREPQLGGAWLVLDDDVIVGHAVVTYGYDPELGGHDSFLAELWIDEHARNGGVATAALSLLADELRARHQGAAPRGAPTIPPCGSTSAAASNPCRASS